MTPFDTDSATHPRLIALAVVLAVLAAAAYLLIGQQILAVGDLQTLERPTGILIVAAGSYLLGGLLILLRSRWLWIVGAVINALVIVFFFQMYADRPSVMLSAGGLASKAAQVLLEVVLVYLIISDWRRSLRQGV
jgi:hypothetical protein